MIFNLNNRSFAYYSLNYKNWFVEAGEYKVLIGSSAADIRLSKSVEVEDINCYTVNDSKDMTTVADM